MSVNRATANRKIRTPTSSSPSAETVTPGGGGETRTQPGRQMARRSGCDGGGDDAPARGRSAVKDVVPVAAAAAAEECFICGRAHVAATWLRYPHQWIVVVPSEWFGPSCCVSCAFRSCLCVRGARVFNRYLIIVRYIDRIRYNNYYSVNSPDAIPLYTLIIICNINYCFVVLLLPPDVCPEINTQTRDVDFVVIGGQAAMWSRLHAVYRMTYI